MWCDFLEAAPAVAFRYLPGFRPKIRKNGGGSEFHCYNATARAASARVARKGILAGWGYDKRRGGIKTHKTRKGILAGWGYDFETLFTSSPHSRKGILAGWGYDP